MIMNRYILYAFTALCLCLASCSDDSVSYISPNPSVENPDEGKISAFDIDPLLLRPDALEGAAFANLKSGYRSLDSYAVELHRSSGATRCGIHLGKSSGIHDGDYLLTFSDADGRPLEGMVRIGVRDEHVISVGEAKQEYSLRHGTGTKEDPYVIGSQRDFLTFLDDLQDDELTNARGLYFKQTADITLPDQSSFKPGRGYFGFSFAGTYDGGGFELKEMYYRGAAQADKDSGVGIFPVLLDGATVRNVRITGVNISGTHSDTGIVAGSSVGCTLLNSVTVKGTITSDTGYAVGGFVGRLEKGNLSVENCDLEANITAHHDVGGVVGRVDAGSLYVNGLTTPESHFSVQGSEGIGGVVGSVTDGHAQIEHVKLSHVVSREDADIRTIQTVGNGSAGGIMGRISGGGTYASFIDVEVACPVGGLNHTGHYIGGILGSATCGTDLIFDGCRVTSIVSGDHEVGGYIGHCKMINGAKPVIKGNTESNYIVPDDSAAGIEANSEAGGVFGYFEGAAPTADAKAVRVGVGVETSGNDCGGAIGKIYGSTFNLGIFNMTSSTMQVRGDSHVGGMVGYASKSTLTGNTPFNYVVSDGKARIPDEKDFEPLFTGIVKGKSDAGGILGYGDNVTLKAMASACTVESIGGDNFGGIAGHIVTKNQDNRMEDLVSRSMVTAASNSNAGGIFGNFYCDDYSYVTDCINYGSVKGGANTGGIFGLYDKNLWSIAVGLREADLRWCLNLGDVEGTDCVAGVAGRCHVNTWSDYDDRTNLYVFKCGNNGLVSGTGSSAVSGVGGIVGYGNRCIKIENCTNNGHIISSDAHKGVGGIAGSLGDDASGTFRNTCLNVEVYKCRNTGTIDSETKSTHVGGILGFMEEGPDSYLKNCMNAGEILHKHNSDNGGILGYVDHLGKIYWCVNRGNVEDGNAAIGTHKSGGAFDHDGLYFLEGTGKSWPSATSVSASDFKNQSKFPKLDFDKIWEMTSAGPDVRDCPF